MAAVRQASRATGVDFGYELDATELSAGEYEIEFLNDGGASHDVRVEREGEDVAMGWTETTTIGGRAVPAGTFVAAVTASAAFDPAAVDAPPPDYRVSLRVSNTPPSVPTPRPS